MSLSFKRFLYSLIHPFPYTVYRYRVTNVLVVINIAIFILTMLFPYTRYGFALSPVLFIKGYRYWTIVTYMFVHHNFSHILFNMLALFFFGTIIERQWGSKEFFTFYLFVGILAGILSLLMYIFVGGWGIFLLGASGAVYGVLLAFACLFPQSELYVFGVFPVKAKVLLLIYMAIQILSVIGSGVGGGGVAYFTHLSGLGIAWLYLKYRHKIDPYRRLF